MNYEAEVIAGLKPFAEAEIWQMMGRRGRLLYGEDEDRVRFEYGGDVKRLFELRMVVAIYECRHFSIPRPKAFLGSQNLIELLRQIKRTRKLHPKERFQSFKIAAAGRHSAIFRRLKNEIAKNTKMQLDEKEPDLLIRIRPVNGDGWEVLTRLTPRPLSARAWRTANMPGALNATVAAVMVNLTVPQPDDYLLNLTCGSGTFLAERGMAGQCEMMVGTDLMVEHLQLAKKNLGTGSLPAFLDLYAGIFAEVDRIATHETIFVLITHNAGILKKILAKYPNWQIQQNITLKRGKITPHIYSFKIVKMMS